MSKTIADQLLDIVTAVRELPNEAQEELVHEIAERVSSYTSPRLNSEQRAEVKRRLANPRYASPEQARAFFARFGIHGA
jgi:hypothetical protein